MVQNIPRLKAGVKGQPFEVRTIDFNEFRDGWQSEHRKADHIAAVTGADDVEVFDKVVSGSKKAAREKLKVSHT